jgi:RNA polymerase sigma factor (sigma-70 family)
MEHENDLGLVQRALAGDTEACAQIRSPDTVRWLEAVLAKRGASSTEAKDITADLFADCFGARDGKPALLEAYHGGGTIRAFFSRAAINRLIDLKRRQKFQGTLPERGMEDAPADEFDLLEGESLSDTTDDRLVELLRDALIHAFSQCDPRDLVLMRLVSIHGVRQETLAASLGWSQSKVSRAITGVMEDIRQKTMEELRKADPWIELEWTDFVAMCRESTDFLVGRPDQGEKGRN